MSQNKHKKRICILLIGINLAFIWGNSLMTGSDSGALSGGILDWINSFLGLGEEGAQLLHLLLRKGVHFTEFACLGMLLTWYFSMVETGGAASAAFCLLGSMIAACTDETIQIFVDGRGSSLLDVWVDTFGALTGIMFFILGHHLRKEKT